MSPALLPLAGPRHRSRFSRRYVLFGTLAAGAILVVSTSAAFLANNGSTSATVTLTGSSTAGEVYSAAGSSPALPSGGPTSWAEAASGTPTVPVTPGWDATAGKPTTVTTAGDVAIVDGTGGQTMITVTLNNAASMASAYTYVNIPIEIQKCVVSSGTCTWSQDTNVPETYLSFSNATMTVDVTGGTGTYYEVVVPTGGSMYPYSTSSTTDLEAGFLVTANVL